jgi:hypothetical protein
VPCRVGHGVEGRHGGSQACVRHCTIGDEVREKGRGSTMMVGSTRGVKGGGGRVPCLAQGSSNGAREQWHGSGSMTPERYGGRASWRREQLTGGPRR